MASFEGHDAVNDETLHLTVPDLAGARTLAQAGVHGSPAVRRRARAFAWVLIVLVLVAPIVSGLLFRAL